jgi:UDP-glucose 4-epimerase
MATVLLTGSRGWIGGLLLDRLCLRGIEVVCLHHDAPAAAVSAAAERAGVIVHAGGVYTSDRARVVPGNIAQAAALADGCSRARNTVVFLSSVKVYGWASRPGEACDEGAPTDGADAFSRSKRLVESLFTLASHRSFSLRISNAYGRGIPRKYAIGTMIDSTRRDGRITLDCTGASLRDFVHAGDVVDVVERIVAASLSGQDGGAPGHCTFNLSSGRLVSLMDVARVFRRALGAGIETRDGRVVNSPGFPNRRAIEAGFASSFREPLEGVAALLKEWKDNPWETC